jgi:polar amino acid transport system substrate-binding protein
MPIDPANSKWIFRCVAGDRTSLPQHRSMPPEKQRQHDERQRQSHWQPDQRSAESFFSAASVAQGSQHQGKEQADKSVAEVEGNTLEREHCGAPARLDQGVQIIGKDEPDGDHGRAEREGEYDAPPSPAQHQTCQGRQGDDREPGEVSRCRALLHHAPRDRRNNETERTKPRPDQAITGCREIDQPEIRAGEGQEESGYRVEQQACQNDEECKRCMRNPSPRTQHHLDRAFFRRRRPVIGRRDAWRPFPAWLSHAEGGHEGEGGRDKIKINWKTQRGALGESARESKRANDPVHKPGIIDRAANEHGDHEADRLTAGDLVEYLGPFRRSPAFGQGVKHERLVSAARQALGDAAQQPVCQAKKEEQSASVERSHTKHCHFHYHSDRGGDDERPASNPICQRAGRQVGADNGKCPGEIQQRVLGCTEAEVEEHDRQNRVIKPRVEKDAEKDKTPPIAIGGVAGIGSMHASWAILSVFASVATAYRNSLAAVTLVVMAALLLFASVANGQEPAQVPTPARTRLVVGLIQSPPFCMRGEDGTWSGISVELWQWIAADLGVDTEFRETTVTGLFDDLAPGRPLDVSIGALTITPEREDRVDFTQPFFLSGLGVAVKTAPSAGGLWSWLGRVLAWHFWRIVAAILVSLVLVALLIWALEQKTNPKEFGGDGKAYRGIGSALWWSAVTMTTVGYGDLAPRSPVGRLVAIAWMFISLFLVSWFTASMASILTAERLDAGPGGFVVRGADDLRRLQVAAIPGTSSEDYLKRRRIDYLRVPLKDLLEVLLTGGAQAVLSDAPSLRYIARSEPYAGKITVLPQTLQTEPYGIALRDDSPWRKPVDRALLHRLATPAWKDLVYRYVGNTE